MLFFQCCKGNGQFTPEEMCDIVDCLLALGDINSLEHLCMFLLGKGLFLQSDETIKLKAEDFIDSHFPDGKVNKTAGKSNKTPKNGKDLLT